MKREKEDEYQDWKLDIVQRLWNFKSKDNPRINRRKHQQPKETPTTHPLRTQSGTTYENSTTRHCPHPQNDSRSHRVAEGLPVQS